MLLAAFLAGLALAVAADDIITKPSPGNEYVSLAVGGHVGRKAHHDMNVHVKDEGTTGYKRSDKPHSIKKAENLGSSKKTTSTLKAAVKDEGAVGVEKKESSGIGVPPLKHISFPAHSEKKSHVEKREDSLDFDDDTPIVPAASSQTSRINVKKGPNGQEYEYEYVYYYYDDEDETTDGKKGAKGDTGTTVRPKPAGTEKPDTPPEPRKEVRQDLQDLRQEQPRHHHDRSETRTQELRQDERHTLRDEPPRHRTGTEQRYQLEREEDEVPATRQRADKYDEVSRGRQPQETGGRGRAESRQEETRRGRPTPANEDTSSRNRYTTIERGRGKASESAVTTAEPSSNEVLPTRSSSRSRGQHVDVIDEERIQPTRFPSRARGGVTSEASRVAEQPQQPPSRSRGQERGGGAVRRPSLVDSSSFRTHSGADLPIPQEEEKPGYLSSQYLNSRESDYEEYIRPTTFLPPPASAVTTILPPVPAVQQPQVTESNEMPQKAALDLYAILQQTQEENSVLDTDVKTTDIPSTEPPTTTPEPTTTTTTTTTTTPPPPPATQRGRFRTGSRQRLRAQSTSTTTEAAAEEEPPKREKFKPSHNRNPGQVSAYGRRRAGASTTSVPTTEAAQPSTRARPNSFGASNNGNRYRSRGRLSTTHSPQEEVEHSEEVEPSSTTARPARARISGTPGARPLRPGPRLNLRPRPGVPSSTPPAEPAAQDEPIAIATTPAEPAPVTPQQHSEGDSLSKLRSRPRLKVQQPSVQPRPFSAVNRRPLPGLRRRTTEAEGEAEVTTPSIQVVETEPPSAPSSSEPPQPQPTESKLSSLISRRRPITRRIQHQPPAEK